MDPQVFTEISQATAATIAAVRLIAVGLASTFPALLAYLVFDAISSFIYAAMSPLSLAYFWVYVAAVPLECVLSILAVRELITLIFASYPGIRTVGHWAIYVGLIAATAISLGIARLLNNGYHHRKWGLYYLQSAQRSIFFSLAVAIVAILFVLSKYPLRLSRSTYVSSGFFSALFLSEVVRLAIDSLTPHFFNDYVDWTEAFFITACLAGWALMLAPEPVPVARIAFSTPEEEHLLHQLDSLNRVLSRAARR